MEASWTSGEFQIAQSAEDDDDTKSSAEPAYIEIAESEQGYSRRRRSNSDNRYRQRTAGTALEVITDCLSHRLQCYPFTSGGRMKLHNFVKTPQLCGNGSPNLEDARCLTFARGIAWGRMKRPPLISFEHSADSNRGRDISIP